MADFPTSITNFGFTAAANKGLPYDVVQKAMTEIVAMETAFISGRARASVYHNTTQSLSNATATPVNFNSENFDVGAMHDPAVNNSRVTIPASNDGVYLLMGGTGFAANATGYRELDLRLNGATILATVAIPINSGAVNTLFTVSFVASLVAGDYLELIATQNSGGALNIGVGVSAYTTFLQVIRLW